jgi:hypothetical protein
MIKDSLKYHLRFMINSVRILMFTSQMKLFKLTIQNLDNINKPIRLVFNSFRHILHP